MTEPSAQEWFGHITGLYFTIAEFHDELTVDGIEQNPRTVMLAIEGIKAKAGEVILLMKQEMRTGANSSAD